MKEFFPLRVSHVIAATRDAVLVTFDVPEELRSAFQFTQGQYLTLRATVEGSEVRRSYSICSAPHEGVLQVAIKRVQDGVFSSWAHQELRVGHVIECMPPKGNFHVPLMSASARHHVAFAAGSGITPILSILKTTLREEPQSSFTLVYGNRSSSAVLFKEELEDLKARYMGRFNLIFTLSREQQDVELFNGRIDGAKCDGLLQSWIDPVSIDVAYLCGPQSMTEGVRASLERHGVARDRIKTELFGTAAAERVERRPSEKASQRCHVTIVQDGRQRDFEYDDSKLTLLDAGLAQGIEMPYSCKGGVCSTCRCKLVKGEVEMDVNFALEDYEVARGFILPCQSYAMTGELLLDYDQES